MPYIDLKKVRTENHWTNRLKDGLRDFGRASVCKVKECVDFVKENPEAASIIAGFGAAAIGGVKTIVKVTSRHHRIRVENYNKDHYIYDPSMHMKLKTKRKINDNDRKYIAKERQKGKTYHEIIHNMDILK